MNDHASIVRQEPIHLADIPDFHLGAVKVSPTELYLSGPEGRQAVQPRVMQVLVALHEAGRSVVSRDALVARCWNGRIVGDDAINRCIVSLRQAAAAFSPPPFRVETVPRVGYKMVWEEGEATIATASTRRSLPSRRLLAMILVGLAFLAGLAITAGWRSATDAEPTRIAVLPFRDLSGGEPFFAAGLSEEIAGRLGADPGFVVAGRMSSDRFANAADARKVGRALGVDYLLEGSVRRAEGRILVDAALVRAENGIRLWNDRYDRRERDVLTVQQEIGSSVARALRRKLAVDDAARPAVASAAYPIYLEARGMLRTRNPQLANEAAQLLHRALAEDPVQPRAWAALADALRMDATLKGPEAVIAILPEARRHARRAIAIDPRSPEGHGVLGALLGYSSPEARAHLSAAARADPRDPQAWLWKGVAARTVGDFDGEIAAYRRAYELDPSWFRAMRDLALATALRGRRAEAEAIVRAGRTTGSQDSRAPLFRIAWSYGDMATAWQGWQGTAGNKDSIWSASVLADIATARYRLGFGGVPRPPIPFLEQAPLQGTVVLEHAPSPVQWRAQNRSADAEMVYRDRNLVAAKLMLSAGRADELAATWRAPTGLLGVRPGVPLEVHNLHALPIVIAMLRQTARDDEARGLLAEARGLARRKLAGRALPFAVEADLGLIEAAAGNAGSAAKLLTNAVERGWAHNGVDDLQRLLDEPALAQVANDPRLRALSGRLDERVAAERRKAIALGLPGPSKNVQ